ncbi:MAG: hypothetical protein FJ265_21385 [Planctomycetes bacterium]|nr:hypothetical protein [Planctomycetota bacterium]
MKTTKTTLLAALALPFLSTSLVAQTSDHLVGLTRLVPHLRHFDHRSCSYSQCVVQMPSAMPLPRWAGGTAWDPVTSGAWVTDGKQLGKFSDACVMQCQPRPILSLSPTAYMTGLEVAEGRNQLVILDSEGWLHFYGNTCPPGFQSMCNTGLVPAPTQTNTSGLAIDEGLGLVFISYCDFATGANSIAVSDLQNPCMILCQFTPPPCPSIFDAITGLAVDWGRRILYATDGSGTMAMEYTPYSPITGCVTIINWTCCPGGYTPDHLVGLAVRPARETSMGQPCGNGACPPCPNVHSLGNDPNLGNAQFHLRLDQAPVGSLAWCLIGAGPCSAPGVQPPPLCGPVYTQPLLGTLGPNPVIGPGGPCTGSTRFAFPLPLNATLAGWTLSSQCVAICAAAAGIGTAVSNCISWTLQGN